MRSYIQYLIAAGLLLAVISVSKCAEVLANSSYPCVGGNAQRTYKINRNTNGRSTVLNVAWIWPPDGLNFDFITTEITTDAEGYIYVQGQELDIGISGLYRVHLANGILSTTDNGFFPANSIQPPASLTHVASGYTYMATSAYSIYLEEATMSFISGVPNPTDVSLPASYVPFGQYMLRTNRGLIGFNDNLLTYWDATTREFDLGALNFQEGTPVDVVIGYNATSEFIIVVSDRSPIAEYPIFTADNFPSNFLSSPPVRAWWEADRLFVLGTKDLLIHDVTNETASIQYSLDGGIDSQAKPVTGNFLMAHEGKSFAHHYFNATRGEFIDRLSFDYITQTPAPYFQWPPIAQPIFSKLDNIVLYPKGISGSNVYFEGRQWGTWQVKVTGRLPTGVVLGANFNITGVPVYGDNCDIAVVHDNKLYGLRPLPIQNVIPIFECFNPTTGIAFFSYNNLEQKSFVIPLTQDRNSFTPYSTPIEDFDVGRGPIYPLSVQLDVGKNLQGYHYWALESYTVPIPFGDNSIICPTDVSVIITLRANGQFPVEFGEVVRTKFVSVTGISDARVTLVAKKRSSHQLDSTLEAELSVAPDQSNAEDQPAEVIQNFVSDQQETFTQQVNNDASAPRNVTIDSVSGKELSGQIVGIKDYVPSPGAPMSSNNPTGPREPSPVSTSEASNIIFWPRVGLVFIFVSFLYN